MHFYSSFLSATKIRKSKLSPAYVLRLHVGKMVFFICTVNMIANMIGRMSFAKDLVYKIDKIINERGVESHFPFKQSVLCASKSLHLE